MYQYTFTQQVSELRQQGTSIRCIASKLGVHPSRVQRAIAKLYPPGTGISDHNVSDVDQESTFIGREEELALLRRKLDEAVAGHVLNYVLSKIPCYRDDICLLVEYAGSIKICPGRWKMERHGSLFRQDNQYI
jgi:hypothetical protein